MKAQYALRRKELAASISLLLATPMGVALAQDQSTADEAAEVKTLIDLGGMKRVILVTSSFHMPRAKMLFDREGIETIPYPTDFRADGVSSDWMDWVPSADGLASSSDAVREFIGRIYYRAVFLFET